MSKVLILFAHPALQRSRVNRKMLDVVKKVSGVTLNDLYEVYPDFHIDIKREQALLLEHDVIIMQHPFYWYSTPAILKEWQDMVLQHGWAYGHEGKMLAGKTMLNVVTTGGPEQAYSADGYNHFTMRQLLAPLEQTATLCRMKYLAPFTIHGTHRMEKGTLETYLQDYKTLLEAIIQDTLDLEMASQASLLNADLSGVMKGGVADVR